MDKQQTLHVLAAVLLRGLEAGAVVGVGVDVVAAVAVWLGGAGADSVCRLLEDKADGSGAGVAGVPRRADLANFPARMFSYEQGCSRHT